MRLGKGKRRLLATLGFLIFTLLLILIAIPGWLPWVLKPVASGKGLTFAAYERKGYSRFALSEVTFTNGALHFKARRAEGLTPGVWLWRCYRRPAEPTPFLLVQDWQLELTATNKPAAKNESSIYTNVVEIGDALRTVRQWLPSAALSNGVARAGTNAVRFSSLLWKNGDLQAEVELPQRKQHAIVKASLKEMPFTAQIASETANVDATISLLAKSDGLSVRGEGEWQTNRFAWDAHFATTGSLPDMASFKAATFRVPGEIARLPDYEEITGDIAANWTNGSFAINLTATGTPAKTSTNVPPAELRFQARGDTNEAVIETGMIHSPWLQADISPGAKIHFSGPLLQEPANVRLRADLAKQPWLKIWGTLGGEADLQPGEGKYPQATFQLSGTNVGTAECEAKTFVLEGQLHWPSIELTRAQAVLDDGSYARLTGQADVETKTISAAKMELSGPAGARWLPAGYGYENALVNIEASGLITNLSHRIHAKITNVRLPQFKPLQVQLDSEGQGAKLRVAQVAVSTGEATLSAGFAVELKHLDTNSPLKLHSEIALDTLEWREEREEIFDLQKSARILLEQLKSPTNAWRAEIANFEWRGKGGDIEINGKADWPESGNFELLVKELRSDILNSFIEEPVEPATIHELSGTFGWTNGPLVFDLTASGEAALRSKAKTPESKPLNLGSVSAQLKARGDGNGVVITNFFIRSETSAVAVASGLVPVTFVPGSQTNFVQLETKKPLDFTLTTQPRSLFWQKFSEWTRVTMQEPELSADISGTWEKPQGQVQLRAAQIKLPSKKSNLPDMEHLEIDLGLDRDLARLTNFSLLVQGQRVTGTGQIPLGEKFWADLKQKKPPNWELASARLQIPEAQISAFAGLFPALLAPQGTFHLDLSLVPGGKLDGELALKEARTRPLPNIGPIRDIAVLMRFVGRTVKLGEISATIGGAPVTAAGEGDLSGAEWLNGTPPPFEFVLFGTNVPLSRQPESIIRSDLNLAIKKTNGAPPLISGNVWLRNSYYLSDLADLVPGKVSSPEKRPPYFSVDEPGLADWRLAVRVGGEHGLRVRSTLFNGEASPNLRLQGTLKEPLALGDVKIENGVVKFPFASLDVQRGYVTLTSEDPYRPHLMVSAASRKFGYDVRMELTGPADQPIIQFNSTPPLSSEQLVLMLTAGELPRGGYTLNPQQRAQTMALFLGKDLLSKLGFGDDSKERLTFSSGQEISETGKPTYSLEYKLTDRWSLVGEYDRFNAFNAGVKWKVYSK